MVLDILTYVAVDILVSLKLLLLVNFFSRMTVVIVVELLDKINVIYSLLLLSSEITFDYMLTFLREFFDKIFPRGLVKVTFTRFDDDIVEVLLICFEYDFFSYDCVSLIQDG